MADDKDKKEKPAPSEKPERATPSALPKPASLDVNVSGKKGKYHLIITVLSDNGLGMKASLIITAESLSPAMVNTDDNGVLIYPVNFTEEQLDVLVQVVGCVNPTQRLEEGRTLEGPPKMTTTPKKSRKPKLTGFLESFNFHRK